MKYKFFKDGLNKLYCSYIRPILEYACEVWDGCNESDKNRLEQGQLNAARIVTGLPVFASLNSLYFETGWETLATRRSNRKLNLMYRIVNCDTPVYLNELLPNRVGHSTSYMLRNMQNFEIPITRSSFMPSTLKLWNHLDVNIRNCESLSQFNKCIRINPPKISDHLSIGERK